MDGNGVKQTKEEVHGENRVETKKKKKKIVVGLRQMRTKDRWGRKQRIIRIKQRQKIQTKKKNQKTSNALCNTKYLKLQDF